MKYLGEIIIPQALASDAAAPLVGSSSQSAMSFIPILLMLAVFYFLIIRPQHKKMKEHKAMVEALRRGDKVITSSGISGVINKIEDNGGFVHVEIADGVIVKMLRSSVSEVITKPQPATKKEK